jgi:G:T-mismatch repair DNA endonuclease (very short patch repair protein)
MDTLTKRQCSVLMAKIRSRGNKATELELMRLLRRAGISGWRRNLPLPGKPDFVFRASHLVVFVDGVTGMGAVGTAEFQGVTVGIGFKKSRAIKPVTGW